jgi:hypothetical protein
MLAHLCVPPNLVKQNRFPRGPRELATDGLRGRPGTVLSIATTAYSGAARYPGTVPSLATTAYSGALCIYIHPPPIRHDTTHSVLMGILDKKTRKTRPRKLPVMVLTNLMPHHHGLMAQTSPNHD